MISLCAKSTGDVLLDSVRQLVEGGAVPSGWGTAGVGVDVHPERERQIGEPLFDFVDARCRLLESELLVCGRIILNRVTERTSFDVLDQLRETAVVKQG